MFDGILSMNEVRNIPQGLERFCFEFNKYKLYLFNTHFVQSTEG